jgi:hypothetical protein
MLALERVPTDLTGCIKGTTGSSKHEGFLIMRIGDGSHRVLLLLDDHLFIHLSLSSFILLLLDLLLR